MAIKAIDQVVETKSDSGSSSKLDQDQDVIRNSNESSDEVTPNTNRFHSIIAYLTKTLAKSKSRVKSLLKKGETNLNLSIKQVEGGTSTHVSQPEEENSLLKAQVIELK